MKSVKSVKSKILKFNYHFKYFATKLSHFIKKNNVLSHGPILNPLTLKANVSSNILADKNDDAGLEGLLLSLVNLVFRNII